MQPGRFNFWQVISGIGALFGIYFGIHALLNEERQPNNPPQPSPTYSKPNYIPKDTVVLPQVVSPSDKKDGNAISSIGIEVNTEIPNVNVHFKTERYVSDHDIVSVLIQGPTNVSSKMEIYNGESFTYSSKNLETLPKGEYNLTLIFEGYRYCRSFSVD